MEIIIVIIILIASFFYVVYANLTTKYGAPYVPLEPDVADRVTKWAKIKRGEILYDLGSGDGRIVIAAALRGAKATGFEIDALRVLYSKIWIKLFRLSDNAAIVRKNIFDVDLSKADIVTMYLLQETNDLLQEKLERELKKGARVISIAFNFPNWKPIAIDPNGPIYGPIYIYQR